MRLNIRFKRFSTVQHLSYFATIINGWGFDGFYRGPNGLSNRILLLLINLKVEVNHNCIKLKQWHCSRTDSDCA